MTKVSFQLARITSRTAPPCNEAQLVDRAAEPQSCVTIAAPIVRNADVVSDEVGYNGPGGGWGVTAVLTAAAGHRITQAARIYAGDEYAMALGREVLSAPVLTSGITGHVISIFSGPSTTRAQAITLATRITGTPPHVLGGQPTTTDESSAATTLCQHLLAMSAYRGDSVSSAGPTTAGRIVATAQALGQRPPVPWNMLPSDDFVADCQLAGAVATRCTGNVIDDLVNVYVDRRGHTSGGAAVPCP
jgi:hypothetical protein